MNRRRSLLQGGGFPPEPAGYELISTHTGATTFSAPENGYFQIEVFGASGNGGAGAKHNTDYFAGGGGGGGGGYACSRIKMNKGDTVVLSPGKVGSASAATINSSVENYSVMNVTSGSNGAAAYAGPSTYYGGAGGAGGKATGGNFLNANGGGGGTGNKGYDIYGYGREGNGEGGSGGGAGYSGGNAGGKGATATGSSVGSPGSGKAGFIKIYRGDTN